MDSAADRDGPSRAPLEIADSKGIQVGDHNWQYNDNRHYYQGASASAAAQPSQLVVGKIPHAAPAFRPREGAMAQLRAAGPGVSVVRAVTGMRGVGKTQLAAAYARECIDAGWRLVAWVNAEDTLSFLSGLSVIADRLGIAGTDLERIGEEVRNLLESDGEKCLLVYDNVTHLHVVRTYVPSAGKAQVVVTSTQAAVLALGKPTPLGVFTADEAVAFLIERSGNGDAAGARLLAEEMGCLPLALAQASAVIRDQRLLYAVYLDRLRRARARAYLDYLQPTEEDPYPHGTAAAILLSIDAVADDETRLCGRLLDLLSLLSPDGAPRRLLYLAGGSAAARRQSMRPWDAWPGLHC